MVLQWNYFRANESKNRFISGINQEALYSRKYFVNFYQLRQISYQSKLTPLQKIPKMVSISYSKESRSHWLINLVTREFC